MNAEMYVNNIPNFLPHYHQFYYKVTKFLQAAYSNYVSITDF